MLKVHLINKIIIGTCFIFKIFSFEITDEASVKIKLDSKIAKMLKVNSDTDAYEIIDAQKILADDTAEIVNDKWYKARSNYRYLMSQFHPDKFADHNLANEISDILSKAHKVLNNTYRTTISNIKKYDEARERYKKDEEERQERYRKEKEEEQEGEKLFNELSRMTLKQMDNHQRKRFIELFSSKNYFELKMDYIQWKYTLVAIVKRAITLGLPINTTFKFSKYQKINSTILQKSLYEKKEFLDLADWLIDNGADVNLNLRANSIYNYPIYQVFFTNCLSNKLGSKNIYLGEKLILAGADLNIYDEDGKSLLYHVFNECHFEDDYRKSIFKLLLINGVNYKHDLEFNGLLYTCHDHEVGVARKQLFFNAIADVIVQYRQKIDIYNSTHAENLDYTGEKIIENIMTIRQKLDELSEIQIQMLQDGYYDYEKFKTSSDETALVVTKTLEEKLDEAELNPACIIS